MIPLFDAHLDLAYNALGYDRDLTQPLTAIRRHEAALTGGLGEGHTSEQYWGTATVSLPTMREADIRVCLATLLARAPQPQPRVRPPVRFDLDYGHPSIAEAAALGQLAYYERLQCDGHLALIRTADELRACEASSDGPLGCILSMEGCDPIAHPDDVPTWWDRGLRTACLAHYRQGRYAYGTGGEGGLTDAGRALLDAFRAVGMILDVVHTAEPGFWQALEAFDGPVMISHGNCRALVPGDRQLSDDQLRAVAERGGVVGVALDAWMIVPNYDRRTTPRSSVTLATLADHVDHICQVVGDATHVGIGSDLDGGFGTEQCPADLDTIADLHKLAPILEKRGYSAEDIAAIFHANWSRYFQTHLPRGSTTA